MPDAASSKSLADLERAVLRAICTQPLSPMLWDIARRELASYVWLEPDHAVVYDAIANVRSREPKNWRSHLVAQTTRMGFPEIDWGAYLETAGKSDIEASELIRKLKAVAAESGTSG